MKDLTPDEAEKVRGFVDTVLFTMLVSFTIVAFISLYIAPVLTSPLAVLIVATGVALIVFEFTIAMLARS